MKLTELDPRWLLKDGKRIGFAFRCPNPERRAKWYMTCFAVPTKDDDQFDAFAAAVGGGNFQPSNEACGWTIAGGIDNATFETMTVTPSIDGGQNMWHGFITNGEIK